MGCVLGIDVGGTSIKAGLFSPEGSLVSVKKIPTGAIDDERAFNEVCEGLSSLVVSEGFLPDDVEAVGLDIPGPVDDRGRVGMLPNIRLDPDGLKAAIRQSFGRARLAFVNDANAAALGELWQGSARDIPSFVMVTLGTGVGGGVVVDRRLVPGAFGAGGEIGHLTVNKSEMRVCGCGRRGCLEQYASATGIVWLYQQACKADGGEHPRPEHATDTITVFDAYREGDACADSAIDVMCDRLGYALAQIGCVIDPAAYLIGGGVAGGFDLFAERLSAAYRSHCLSTSAGVRILPCSLGNKAGMYGVAYAAMQEADEAR